MEMNPRTGVNDASLKENADLERLRGKEALKAGEFARGLEHSDAALKMYEELNDKRGKALCVNNIGVTYFSTGDYPQAFENLERARELFEELNDQPLVYETTHLIGILHRNVGNIQTASEYYRRSLEYSIEIGDKVAEAHLRGSIGVLYSDIGDYDQAFEEYRRALAMNEDLGFTNHVAGITGNIGNLYEKLGDFPQALQHHLKALTLHEKKGDRARIAASLSNIGNVYFGTGDYHNALVYYRRALSGHEELGDKSGTALVTGNIGSVLSEMGSFAEGMEHLERSRVMLESVGDQSGVLFLLESIAESYIDMNSFDEAERVLNEMSSKPIEYPVVKCGYYRCQSKVRAHKGDLEGAREQLMLALELAESSGMRDVVSTVHKGLRDLAKLSNDFESYIKHNDEFNRISEEVKGKQTTQKLTLMEAELKIESERQEREKERALLYGTLPKEVADRILRGESVTGDNFSNASVLFIDVVGFTTLSNTMPPTETIQLLERLFGSIDEVCKKYSVTKIKTIGDSYMAVSFDN